MKCKDCENIFGQPFARMVVRQPKDDILNVTWNMIVDYEEVCPYCHGPNIE